jgi:hypothetical protein
MAAEGNRKRGARAAIDWEAAFAFYAALPPAERSYAAVAAKFAISVRTVETHGRSEQWKARLRQIKEETRSRIADALTEARVEEIEKLRRLIDASFVAYAEALRNGMRMSTADLERLNRISLGLLEEVNAFQLASNEPERPPDRTAEHASAVLDALAETGELEKLGLTFTRPEPADPNDKKEADHEHY